MKYKSVPQELQRLPRWVVHKDKIPYCPETGRPAKTNNPSTWGTFAQAESILNFMDPYYSGLGFVFTADDDLVGVDFDHCITDGALDPWVRERVEALGSYTEISPSGTGVHVICRGRIPRSIRSGRAEMYDQGRYFTVTGNSLDLQPQPVRSSQAALNALYNELSQGREKPAAGPTEAARPAAGQAILDDELLINKARQAGNGAAFAALWAGDMAAYGNDHSRADLALCNLLAFWTSGNPDQMDRLFRQSGLMRDKWDRRQNGSTYGGLQIEKAIRESNGFYDPEQYRLQQARKDFAAEAKHAQGLQVFSAAELARKDLPDVRFIVDGLLPQGLALLSSPPKYGKSWLVLDLCLSVATGADFLGRRTHKCDCLYLALEDSENRIQGRLRKLLNGSPAPDNFAMTITAPDLDNGLLDQLGRYIDQRPDTGLVVIDTLQKVRGSSNRNEGAYKYDYREIGAIKAFADRRGILVLLVHHLRKMADDTDPHNRISGTNGIMGAADTSLVLTKDRRSEEKTTLSITGRDVDTDDQVLQFDKESCKWAPVDKALLAREAVQRYRNDPLVCVVNKVVFDNGGRWTGTMKDLIDASCSIPGGRLQESPRRLTFMLGQVSSDLLYYDDITYKRAPNGRSGGSRYTFECQNTGETGASWPETGGEEAHTKAAGEACSNPESGFLNTGINGGNGV